MGLRNAWQIPGGKIHRTWAGTPEQGMRTICGQTLYGDLFTAEYLATLLALPINNWEGVDSGDFCRSCHWTVVA